MMKLALVLAVLLHSSALAQAKRVVVIKADGLSHEHVDRFVAERDRLTGESLLPNIERIFYERGARLRHFYSRGLSLSAPSWSLLDTGQHLQIKGNVEYDRFTLRTYDYLNFFPFYFDYYRFWRVDKVGAEVFDNLGIPLLFDAFKYEERYQSFQLFQRGARWTTIVSAPKKHFAGRSLRDAAGEFVAGIALREMITEQYERDVIERLSDPRAAYFDVFTAEFDHAAHLTRDRATLLGALQNIDAMIGRLWAAIERSPMAAQTVLILVSDHSLNTDEKVYSQGYSLVSLFNSAAGGAHHVVTDRYPLSAYQFKGFNPLVDIVVTPSADSFYLKGQGSKYPTALFDLDGNERASIHLRNNDLNALHILWLQLKRKDLSDGVRQAAGAAFFDTLDRNRTQWSKTRDELREELVALRSFIEKQRALFNSLPKKWSQADKDAGRDKEALRIFARFDQAEKDERKYSAYLRTLENLLALKRDGFDPGKIKLEDEIAPRAMGEPNSIHDLQNYIVGLSPNGLSLASDGSLDWAKSFRRVNYFPLLCDVAVRNNVQPGIGSRPVDFIALRAPREAIAPALSDAEQPDQDAVWLYGGDERQALILARQGEDGQLQLRYLPVARLSQDAEGRIGFSRVEWRPDLPLQVWEDAKLPLLSGQNGDGRALWLSDWHSESEWLRAIHETKYSNALIGLHEHLALHRVPRSEASRRAKEDWLLERFRLRQRRLTESDLLVLANDHWNFNVRDFNPGGNHAALFRISTRSTLMFAGGARTGVPRASLIEQPYDSLSFAPTVFALLGHLEDGQLNSHLRERGFQPFPGRVIKEVLNQR